MVVSFQLLELCSQTCIALVLELKYHVQMSEYTYCDILMCCRMAIV